MAELDISPEAVHSFLRERGGRVLSTELVSTFRPLLQAGGDAAGRAERRQRFKAAVNAVAVVKERGGAKFVVLRRELRTAPPLRGALAPGGDGGAPAPVPVPVPVPAGRLSPLPPEELPLPPEELPSLREELPSPPEELSSLREELPLPPEELPLPPEELPLPPEELLLPPEELPSLQEELPSPPEELPSLQEELPSPPEELPSLQEELPSPPEELPSLREELPSLSEELPSPQAVSKLRDLFQGDNGRLPLPAGAVGFRREPLPKPCMLPVRCVPPPATAVPGLPEKLGSPLSPPPMREEARSRSPGPQRGHKIHRASEEMAATLLEEAEHQWLVMVASGQWTQQLHGLLLGDASLASRRDFISGFTALHWAAKSGNCDMVTSIIRVAEKGGAHIDVNARSHSGYTALHLAAIHGQEKIITMLVYSYHAKTDLRDYSGKKPHQYLKEGTSSAIRRLLGDPTLSHNLEPSAPIKKTTKLAASILSSTSTFLGVISDDMAFCDLTKGLRKPSTLNKLLAATTGPRRKPKTRGGFPSYSSLSQVVEEEEEEVTVKRRPVSELFFGH